MKKVLLLFLALSFVGCSEYWWSRGQAPSVESLVNRASERLSSNAARRPDVYPSFKKVQEALISAYEGESRQKVVANLDRADEAFSELGRKLSYGSRPAYGELSGQLRALRTQVSEQEKVEKSTIGLFTARTLFFFADELTVPAPAPITYKGPEKTA